MALGWNEIKEHAVKFSKEWAGAGNEEADSQSFLIEFFNVFGISNRKVATFQHKVKKLDKHEGYIDLLWKGTIFIEMKSRGKNLDKAVDLSYRPQPFIDQIKRIEYLFELYDKYTAGLFVKEKKKKSNKK